MDVSRRTFLKTAAAGAAATSAVGTASATPTHDPYSGVVSTRNHFDITWYGDVYLTDGHDRTDYDLIQTIPGMTDDASPEELIVFIHGWKHTAIDARTKFRQVTTALRGAGVTAPVVGYSWDSDGETLQWWDQVEIADRNADKFGTFVRDYHDASPGTNIRVIAHSLGAKTIAECLEFFMDRGYGANVTSVDLLGGAIDNDSVSTGGQYGHAIGGHCDHFRNYYKTDDQTLLYQYRAAMWDAAVGQTGIEGTAPANYDESDVSYVTAHDDYPKPDTGCIPEVVSNWQ